MLSVYCCPRFLKCLPKMCFTSELVFRRALALKWWEKWIERFKRFGFLSTFFISFGHYLANIGCLMSVLGLMPTCNSLSVKTAKGYIFQQLEKEASEWLLPELHRCLVDTIKNIRWLDILMFAKLFSFFFFWQQCEWGSVRVVTSLCLWNI